MSARLQEEEEEENFRNNLFCMSSMGKSRARPW
jgi:hypothetical protein